MKLFTFVILIVAAGCTANEKPQREPSVNEDKAAMSPTSSIAKTIVVKPHGNAGPCTVADWKLDWPNCEYEDGVKEGHLSVVSRVGEKRFRVDYEIGGIGPEKGGVGWFFPIEKRESATLTYVLRFSSDFDWVKGGKLPGFSGGPESVTGGRPANGTNGFSCRLMWRADGRGEAYVYHMNQKGKYGDSFPFPEDFRYATNTDITVKMKITMNTPGRRDGTLRVWIESADSPDVAPVVTRDDIEWRSVTDFGVDKVCFETFHGGGDATWAPSKDCWTEFGTITVDE